MNMLIGVLCEVMSEVSFAEKENAAIDLMKRSVLLMLKSIDEDGSGEISKEEMHHVVNHPEAVQVLEELEVDVNYFVEMSDMLFDDEDSSLTIENIMKIILDLRG